MLFQKQTAITPHRWLLIMFFQTFRVDHTVRSSVGLVGKIWVYVHTCTCLPPSSFYAFTMVQTYLFPFYSMHYHIIIMYSTVTHYNIIGQDHLCHIDYNNIITLLSA